MSIEISFGEKNYKYLISCLNDNHKVKPLHIVLPKSPYVKSYDEQTKCMYFLIEDDDLLEKYSTTYEKNLMTMKLQIFMIKKF